ncbi:MAG TPA: glycosyltransferase family 39 protein [bacterium]|nr:glycosyltransferase family 39 protein [bacterium]
MNEHTRDRLLVTGLGLIGCTAGLVLASQRGTWTDEAATIFAVSKPLGEMLRDIGRFDVNPPGGYLALWLWGKLGGSLTHMRALSGALFGLAVVLTYALGHRLVGRVVGFLGAILFGIAPLSLYLAAQARYPMLLTVLLLGATLAVLALAKSGSTRAALAWAALGLAAAYVHYFSAFVLLAHLLFLLTSWKSLADRRKVVAALAAMAVLYLPWLIVLAKQLLAREAAGGGEHVPFYQLLPLALVYLTQGFSYWRLPSFWREFVHPSWSFVPLLAALPFVFAVGCGLAKQSEDRLTRRLLVWLTVAPLGGFLLASLALDLFAPHYFLPLLPYLCVAAASGVTWYGRRARFLGSVLAMAVVVIGVGGAVELINHPDEPEGWRPVALTVAAQAEPGDAVLLPNLAARFCYLLHKTDELDVYHTTMVAPGRQVVTPEMIDQLLPLLAARYRRLWVVTYYPPRFDPQQALTKAALHFGGLQPAHMHAGDERVGLSLLYLRRPFAEGGFARTIVFPDGPQHPTQLGAGWYASNGPSWWTAGEALAILPAPRPGEILALDAYAPLDLLGKPQPRIVAEIRGREIELPVADSGIVRWRPDTLPGEADDWLPITLRCERTFKPDDFFHDGDAREKCLLVERLGWERP